MYVYVYIYSYLYTHMYVYMYIYLSCMYIYVLEGPPGGGLDRAHGTPYTFNPRP